MVDSQDKEAWEQSQLEQASAYRLQLEANGQRRPEMEQPPEYPHKGWDRNIVWLDDKPAASGSEHPVAFDHTYFLGIENAKLKDQVSSLSRTITHLSIIILFLVIVDLVLLLAFGL